MALYKNSKFREQNSVSEDILNNTDKKKEAEKESLEIDKIEEEKNKKYFEEIKKDKKFSKEQLKAIEYGLLTGMNIRDISNHNFSALKIKELVRTYELEDDPTKYLNLNFLQLRYVINYELEKFKKAKAQDYLYQLGPEQEKENEFKMELFDIVNSTLYTKGSYAIESDINNRLIASYFGYTESDGSIKKQCLISEGVGAEVTPLFAFIVDNDKNIEGKIIEREKGLYKETCEKWAQKAYKKIESKTKTIDEIIYDIQKENEREKAEIARIRAELAQGKRRRDNF